MLMKESASSGEVFELVEQYGLTDASQAGEHLAPTI